MVDFDVKAILKDKRLIAGLGVAAAVGLVVFLRRRSAGTGTGGAAGSAPSSGGFYAGTGTADTTGTDMASFLSGWGNDMLSALKQQQPSPGGNAAPIAPTSLQMLSTTDFTAGDGPWRRYTWSPVTGAKSYVVRFPGDSNSYTVTDTVADWHYPGQGQISVTPIMGTSGN